MRARPTRQDVLDKFTYDTETGWFVHLRGRCKGRRAGTENRDGYRQLWLNGQLEYEHCLVHLLQTGVWPECQVDHADTVPNNNARNNIRPATSSQNMFNVRCRNKLGLKGVTELKPLKDGTRRFAAKITVNYRTVNLGTFRSVDAAHAAYCAAAAQYAGEYRRAA